MIDIVDEELLRRLIECDDRPAVSIYLPVRGAGPDAQQNRIRLKNILGTVSKQLTGLGASPQTANEILDPAQQLRRGPRSWDRRAKTLALFLSAEGMRKLQLPVRFPELVVVADAFHVKPLFSLLNRNGRFYVLAISHDQVRLLRGSQYGFMRVKLKDAPANIAEALGHDRHEKQLQFHTGTPGGPGRRRAMFHGQGIGIDNAKTRLEQYLRIVEQSIGAVLGSAREPLILACVDPIAATYAAINTYDGLVAETIRGNPDTRQDKELWALGWPIAEPLILAHQDDAICSYQERAAGRPASEDIEQIGMKACQGEVDELFVVLERQYWGRADDQACRIEQHDSLRPGDRDLLDFAATETFRHGGRVYAVDQKHMPANGPAAALLRF